MILVSFGWDDVNNIWQNAIRELLTANYRTLFCVSRIPYQLFQSIENFFKISRYEFNGDCLRQIRKHHITSSKGSIRNALRSEWGHITAEETSMIAESMRMRLEAVIKAKRGVNIYYIKQIWFGSHFYWVIIGGWYDLAKIIYLILKSLPKLAWVVTTELSANEKDFIVPKLLRLCICVTKAGCTEA